MENVLTGVVFFFLLIFAVLRIATAAISSDAELRSAQLESDSLSLAQDTTRLEPVLAEFSLDGQTITALYRNTGEQSLYDFAAWDVIVHYYDSNIPAEYYLKWLPYTDDVLDNNQWKVDAIYRDYVMDATEVYETTILNTGEEIALNIQLNPPPAAGTTVLINVSTEAGSVATMQITRNSEPVLVLLNDLSLISRTSADINSTMLQFADNESPTDELIYTVVTEPTQGYLNLGMTFTQADIDAGLLTYVHIGDGGDFFEFVVSDGEAEVGPYIMNIIATNAEPVLAANAPIIVAIGGTVVITNSVLRVEDVDNDPTEITYTITVPPTFGLLSLTPTFTQADIDSGYLTYTNLLAGSDNFTVVIDDGTDAIGTYVFNVQTP